MSAPNQALETPPAVFCAVDPDTEAPKPSEIRVLGDARLVRYAPVFAPERWCWRFLPGGGGPSLFGGPRRGTGHRTWVRRTQASLRATLRARPAALQETPQKGPRAAPDRHLVKADPYKDPATRTVSPKEEATRDPIRRALPPRLPTGHPEAARS